MKYLVKGLAALCAVLIIISQTSCSAKTASAAVSRSEFMLDTVCEITVYGLDKDEANEVLDSCFELCAHYDEILQAPVEYSEETRPVIEKGLYYSALTDGLFDISIGELTALWNFGEAKEPPSDKAILKAMLHEGYALLELTDDGLIKYDPAIQIDLGGIAKGYIADRLTDHLESLGVESAIVNLGGNVEVLGSKNGKDFRVGIKDPREGAKSSIYTTVEVSDKTVVTSGTYERYFDYEGVRYHHVLSPYTGRPVETDLLSATVIGPRGTSVDCDALSTICLLLGKEKSRELISSLPDFDLLLIENE